MVGRAQVNKSHKTKFSSKSSRNIHKTTLKDKHHAHSEHNVGKGARAARMQRNNMAFKHKRAVALNAKRAQRSSTSAPRVIVLFGLAANVDLDSLQRDLLEMLSAQTTSDLFPTVISSNYKMRATVLKAPHGDLLSCIEMAKVADLIMFVASMDSLYKEGSADYIDSFGALCLSIFRSIGLPSSAVFIRDLPSDLKRRQESKKLCISSLTSEMPPDSKFYPADSKDELHKFLRLLNEQTLTTPHWRNDRAYVVADKVEMLDHDFTSGKCSVLLTGYVRARNLSVNQLVHIAGAGDYQLCKIEILKDPYPLNSRKEDSMDADDVQNAQVIHTIIPDGSKQEPLVVEQIPDPLAGEQTWPTEAELAVADEGQKLKKLKKRRLPVGTSEYQAAWIVDNSDEDDYLSGDEAVDGMVMDEGDNSVPCIEPVKKSDFDEDQGSLYLGDSDGETETDSVMVDGENMTKEQIENDIKRIKDAHGEDEEFPDEVDAPIDVPAKKRYVKYRPLKSLRTSSWDHLESLPQEFGRIFTFDCFARIKKHVLAKASEVDKESSDEIVAPGKYIRLYIKEVPFTAASKVCQRANTMPIIACGLLQHESKMSVLHFSIEKHHTYTEPIKSKDELTFHVGFRQFVARPIFSTDNFNADKHKMEKFLHAGSHSVASIYAPITFPSLPLIALKNVGDASDPVVAATGSLKAVNPNRIILKKIILTGYPQRVSKVKAAVRYMFHHPEDVRWFKPVEIYTKGGRRGRIKEPIGTHGAMKCLFNGVLQQNDTVCMSLYKRVYPKWPENKFPLV